MLKYIINNNTIIQDNYTRTEVPGDTISIGSKLKNFKFTISNPLSLITCYHSPQIHHKPYTKYLYKAYI